MEEKLVKTYIAALDSQIGGGLPEKHVTLVSGPPGSMKSTFAYSIAYNRAKETGENTLYISLEQSRTSLERQMKKFGFVDDDARKKVHIMDMGFLRKELSSLAQEGEQTNWLPIVLSQIKNLHAEIEYTMLIVDSLEGLYSISDLKNPRNDLFHFFSDIKDIGLSTLFVSELMKNCKEYGFGTYGVEAFLADGVIHISLERAGSSVGRLISIVKMREVEHPTDYFPLLSGNGEFRIVTR